MILVDGRFASHCETEETILSKGLARFAKRWIEAILNRDKQMSQRNPQENGAFGWCPFRKQRETEIALLDPVYFNLPR